MCTTFEWLNARRRLRLADKAREQRFLSNPPVPLTNLVRVYSIPEVFFNLFLGIESQIETRTISIKGIKGTCLWKSSVRGYSISLFGPLRVCLASEARSLKNTGAA